MAIVDYPSLDSNLLTISEIVRRGGTPRHKNKHPQECLYCRRHVAEREDHIRAHAPDGHTVLMHYRCFIAAMRQANLPDHDSAAKAAISAR